ncbi:RteC domain-containing protein [Polaribacter ponticola]|uniref:RteC domain-containing protein n=1 Tax=Polaribacter ponticola TaxID=2978475 RepID=A0ABT5S9W7_9FLAO|nr:RteC domain-containing protein [Polaribacter sp. MSW5]MDD7914909.1 RteC domain-containing protein [Polaribacter sp. MSW5]
MKNNIPLVEQYYVQQKKYTNEKINNIEKLNLQLELAKQVLNDLRVYIRNNKFKDSDEEIDFFKHIKPNIYADFIFYNCLLKYHVNKPNATNSILKNYFKNELKKLESKKRKNLKFYQYYKHNSTFLDHLYFLRENKQLDLFSIDISIYLDSEFYTSHDKLAAEVIAYDLLTNFYKQEINKLKNIASGKFDDNNKIGKSPLNWTASKTDLIELVYVLKVSGAINTGNINTKALVNIFSSLFNIEVSNHYKIYSDIKNRSTERTKFLKKLVEDFQTKLEYDDGI